MAEHEHRNAKNPAVVHNASKQRFEINIDGQLSVLEYAFKNHRLFLTHTEVPPALESQGLGMELAHAALEYARQNDLTVIAICPFVQEYVASHPEYQSFVTTSVAWASPPVRPYTELLTIGYKTDAASPTSVRALQLGRSLWKVLCKTGSLRFSHSSKHAP